MSDPLAALREPEFRHLIGGTFLGTTALLIQEVLVAYELYKLTRDPLTLGFIGLAEALPFIALALFGGHFADRRDKRRIMQVALAAILLVSVALAILTAPAVRAQLPQHSMLLGVYAMFMLLGFARGFYAPAASSLKAFLVPRALYGNATTWSSMFWQAGAICGPAIAGFLYAGIGLTGSLVVVVALFAANFALVSLIRPRPVVQQEVEHENVWQSLREGIDYVRRTRVILYAISLDMFSVLFGGVVAILPVFTEEVLRVGPERLGILRAAPALGALVTILYCAWHPPLQQAWRNLLLAVIGFGLATLAFAISTVFWISCAALVATGACDSVSVVIRGTLLQTIPPDHLRGRVQAVNSIFVSSSNELGAFESGVAARLLGAVPSVLFGGFVTLATVGWIWRRSRDLFAVRLQ